jgi:hypothetical protein
LAAFLDRTRRFLGNGFGLGVLDPTHASDRIDRPRPCASAKGVAVPGVSI